MALTEEDVLHLLNLLPEQDPITFKFRARYTDWQGKQLSKATLATNTKRAKKV
jgi:hypothetical protein